DLHPRPVTVEPLDVARVGDPEPLIVVLPAPCRVAEPGLEECGLGLPEVTQRLLLHVHRTRAQPLALPACLGELPTLPGEPRSGRTARLPVRVLLDRQVPRVPGMRAVLQQQPLLHWRRAQPEPGHRNTIASAGGETTATRRTVTRPAPAKSPGVRAAWMPRRALAAPGGTAPDSPRPEGRGTLRSPRWGWRPQRRAWRSSPPSTRAPVRSSPTSPARS